MVGEIAAQHALPQEVVERVSERTGGVPLFVEEVTRLLVERGEQGGSQAIPPTLQQSLAARLDRLGPAREVAQIGAVLGRDFDYALLRDIAEADESTLQASLDRLADADLLFIEGAPPEAKYRFKHALIQDAAYESLLKSRRQALHRRAAEALREANAEPEAIAHHFTEAGLDDLAIEWWGKAGDQALRRSAFQEAIAHLGKAIEMADKAGGIWGHQQQLHTAYGNALIATRGYAAPETTEAFARARESAAGDKAALERLSADYGLWAGSYSRGELNSMRAHAEAFLNDVGAGSDSPEGGVAHRASGMTHWFAGEYQEARDHLERAVALFEPGRDDDLAFRFGHDAGVASMLTLAFTLWPLGEVDRAASLVAGAQARTAGLTHVGTLAYTRWQAAMIELLRSDHAHGASNAVELARLARQHDLPAFRAFGLFLVGATTAEGRALSEGLADMRRGVDLIREQNILLCDGLIKIALAEAEARAGDLDRALAILDEALATSERISHRSFEAELHRIRGEMLLKRNPANPTAAEEALQAAIAVAKQQGTRSFDLRASLALAKVYQSTGRPVEAHAVLAPALEGFSPTPEMPEIAEAQALLAALSATGEVKALKVQRERRLHLQTTYGQAMMMAKGFAAAETRAAFARAAELTGTAQAFSERFAVLLGQLGTAATAGELRSARELVLTLSREADEAGRITEARGVNWWLGLIAYWHGDFLEARTRCERAIIDAEDQNADPKVRERFGDFTPHAMSVLAATMWQLGEVERARELIDLAINRASEGGNLADAANQLFWKSYLEVWRGDPAATLSAGEALERIAREHGMAQYLNEAELHLGWARGWINDPMAGAPQVQRVLAAFVEQGVKVNLGFYTGLLAQLEAETLGAEAALARIDEAFRLSNAVEHGCSVPFLHRLCGEILLKRDPSDPAPAEEAFRTSIAIAKEQSARSPVLLASLALAKLLQSTGRHIEGHAVLAAALEGFSPTPEMPQIAEAQALLAALAEAEEVKTIEAQRQRRLHLQTSYGQAMMWAKGFAAEETRAALSRATELTAKTDNFAERFAAAHVQWVFALVRGELESTRQLASAFLKEAEAMGRAVEAGVARRCLALAYYQAADFREARIHCERALEACDYECERETQERFHDATGPIVTSVLAVTMWQLGEVDRARELIEQANHRGSELGHGPSMAHPLFWKSRLEILRGDAAAALSASEALDSLSREHGMPFWRAEAGLSAGWARGRLHDAAAGAEDLRRALVDRVHPWFSNALLAELEAEALGTASGLARIDEAMAHAQQVENCCNLAFPFLLRGELLLKRDPSNSASAEEAFQTALEITKQQGARSWGLRAALSLAKLYQSTGRAAEAHAVLAPALEGFTPTPEMPEIAEAQTLLAVVEAGVHVKRE
jgi:predicted ATPase